jgi:hypothetical protein
MKKKRAIWFVLVVIVVALISLWIYGATRPFGDLNEFEGEIFYCESDDDCYYIGEECTYCSCGNAVGVSQTYVDYVCHGRVSGGGCESGCDVRAMSLLSPSCLDNMCFFGR